MEEKAVTDEPSHHEDLVQSRASVLAEATGHRQVAALNIVENPLMVSFPILNPSPCPVVISSINIHRLTSYSLAPKNRLSSMRGLSPSRTIWLSTPTCSVVPL